VKLGIRARIGQAGGAHVRNGASGRMRRLTATTLVLATTTGGGLTAYGLTTSTLASAHTIDRASANAYVLTIKKTADRTFFIGSGQVITYTYTVTNNNPVLFTDVKVGDDKIGSVCALDTVYADTIRTCTATYTTTRTDVSAGSVTNTATVYVRGIPSAKSLTVRVPFRAPFSVPVTG
jgi:hypothetical protein